jgi:hypothetical protein
MSFLSHVETIISKSARMLSFIKRISREFNDYYTDKALFVSLIRPNLEYAACVWSATRRELSVSNIGSLFTIFARQSTHFLESLEDRRTITGAFFIRDSSSSVAEFTKHRLIR